MTRNDFDRLFLNRCKDMVHKKASFSHYHIFRGKPVERWQILLKPRVHMGICINGFLVSYLLIYSCHNANSLENIVPEIILEYLVEQDEISAVYLIW